MNRIEITGRLTQDPDLQTTTTGKSIATLRLAIDRRDRDADPVDVDVKCWNGLADTCAKFLSKGRLVAVAGRLDYSEWKAEDGTRRSKHEVVADDVDFLDRASVEPSEA